MQLKRRIAWITGGARMGLEVARTLARSGCRIVLTYRKSKRSAQESADLLQSEGADVLILPCDISKSSAIQRAVISIRRHFGALHCLINLSSMYEEGAWEKHIEQNTKGAYRLTDAVADLMRRSGGGRIIHIADWTSTSGRPRYKEFSGYYVSKAAIQAIVEAKALELAPHILVNAIAPGPVLPPKGMSKKEFQSVVNVTPLKRWGGAEEIAKAARFLCETDFVTGETIRVDGGRHLY